MPDRFQRRTHRGWQKVGCGSKKLAAEVFEGGEILLYRKAVQHGFRGLDRELGLAGGRIDRPPKRPDLDVGQEVHHSVPVGETEV